MSASLVTRHIEDILRDVITDAVGRVYLINPGRTTVHHLIEVLDPSATGVQFCVLAEKTVLSDVMDTFSTASMTADLVSEHLLELRVLDGEPENAVLVTPHRVVALISLDGDVVGLSTDREAFVERMGTIYDERWEQAVPYRLRTPPRSQVYRTLAEEISPQLSTDFEAMLSALESTDAESVLDEVSISLLVAARNSALLYDISKWGEDVGIASKATFSRTKTELEEGGLIRTEKVPIDVGRPRLRLQLGEDAWREVEIDELTALVVDILS